MEVPVARNPDYAKREGWRTGVELLANRVHMYPATSRAQPRLAPPSVRQTSREPDHPASTGSPRRWPHGLACQKTFVPDPLPSKCSHSVRALPKYLCLAFSNSGGFETHREHMRGRPPAVRQLGDSPRIRRRPLDGRLPAAEILSTARQATVFMALASMLRRCPPGYPRSNGKSGGDGTGGKNRY